MRPVRLLFVEDSESDLQLMLTELRHHEYIPFYERINTAQAMRAALDRNEWDVVISEYALTRFSGMEALFLSQTHNPDLPVIIVSNDITDDQIVAAMKAGARDFIYKNRLERLPFALRRELDQAVARHERRRAEAALYTSEARYRAIVEDQTELICCFLADHTVTFVNEAYCRFVNQSRHSLLGRSFMPTIPPDERAAVQARLEALTPKEPVASHENSVIVRGGETRWVYWTNRAIFDGEGRLIEYQAVGRDITERKQMEDELRRARVELERRVAERTAELAQANAALRVSEERLQLALRTGTISIWDWDLQTGQFYIPPFAKKAVGFEEEEAVDTLEFWHSRVHPDDLPTIVQALSDYLANVTPEFAIEGRVLTKDGSLRWVSVHGILSRDAAGQPSRMTGWATDITEQKQAEQEIASLNEMLAERAAQLEEANEALKSFTYTVSHDLKRPVTQIFGFTDILLQDYGEQLDVIGRNSLQNIYNSAQYMGQLIDALLELSVVGQSKLIREPVDMSELVQTISDELRQTQIERKVEFVITPNIMAKGDERLLRVALHNLLENAWKYTGKQPQALIEFGVKPDTDHAIYFVRDNGEGFDATTAASSIFQPFQRLHHDVEGTGIGLATVQRIIRRHGGQIWAESVAGQGATFYFTL